MLDIQREYITDKKTIHIHAPRSTVFDVVTSIGGQNGWYYANALWQIRGWIDEQLGGVGIARGRLHPQQLSVGDYLDFWRVEAWEEHKLLRLRAEMKIPGKAWLEYQLTTNEENSTTIVKQTAYYEPHGVWGYLYWYAMVPAHYFIFNGIVREIKQRTEKKGM
ncbi:hypothetical protein BHU72_13725 [Desulfuribacillus stibiiarsenatis]|uniref:DUF2867 domain-containing protein n=1 Tax=Desulfuribacillus stibiiarsenatis TaxID=1390249 RepID=A0A1E5L815_9FIRM|nr:DUF2867 domain-containing protein [Desulfuribacillus stibiiarsenatis]OEH86281.1 hypothetical protein BHU72_13725 [Desulfuribacillus stibiiarsenatis]